MINKNKIYTYGSLRVGKYNYDRFKEHFGEGFKYDKTVTIKEYALFHNPSLPYPYAVFTGNANDVLEVDVMNCNDSCKETIDSMEFGAGYKEAMVSGITIYCLDKAPANSNKIIGNWCIYTKHNNLNY